MSRSWTIWMAVLLAIIIMDAVITYIEIPLYGIWFLAAVIGLMFIITYVLVKTWDYITAKRKTSA